jgi:exonuclease SbcD
LTASAITTPAVAAWPNEAQRSGADIPIVAMGTCLPRVDKRCRRRVRELYVGLLAHGRTGQDFSRMSRLSGAWDLHVHQIVNGSETVRYSGSPLPLGFGEAKQRKSVCLVEFRRTIGVVHPIEVAVCFKVSSVSRETGTVSQNRITRVCRPYGFFRAGSKSSTKATKVIGDLRERLEAAVSGTQM